MRRVPITDSARTGWAYVRELRGDDEESVADTETWTAIALLDRLLVRAPGAAVTPGEASSLSAADRDRMLAAIYARDVGERVAATATCPRCGQKFDLDFQLPELLATLAPDTDGITPDGPGRFALADGTRFRVPSGEDELIASAAADPVAALAERCRVDAPLSPEQLAEALERVAPLLDLSLDAVCPECGYEHEVYFDLQRFFLGRLVAERSERAIEVHRLARSYGWSLTEILSLPRSRRRFYVELVEREAERA